MKQKSKSKIVITRFEPVREGEENKLIGGFSGSLSGKDIQDSIGLGSNNCEGGNCSSGCGIGQNVGCNSHSGCNNDNGTNSRCG
jgi:hypothetical protein